MSNRKTLFAQLMDFLPWSTFDRIVARYHGNRAVRALPCAAQFLVMALCSEPVHRSTLADANERRDWRIHAEFAQRLIAA